MSEQNPPKINLLDNIMSWGIVIVFISLTFAILKKYYEISSNLNISNINENLIGIMSLVFAVFIIILWIILLSSSFYNSANILITCFIIFSLIVGPVIFTLVNYKQNIVIINKITPDNERLKNDVEKLTPENKRLKDDIEKLTSKYDDCSKKIKEYQMALA